MNLQTAKQALKTAFGYDSFRLLQEQAIQLVYDKKDAVIVMPTGGGKSICYQIPAITLPGLTIVISPLIALMKDQVEALKANGIPAAFLNSTNSSEQDQSIKQKAASGKLKLLYLSPERLQTTDIKQFLKSIELSLIAIDEAHCVSTWGHDFRPEYASMGKIRNFFPEIPFLALTATADKATQTDIASQLNLRNPEVLLSSFERTNLKVSVKAALNRYKEIEKWASSHKGQAGIVYCLSRKSCQEVAAKLKKDGHNAAYYHAGLKAEKRDKVQEDFLKDDIHIICATIAFGMGIDKANIRWVIHHNMPKNIESYYQEIGRAGRDGMNSQCILYYSIQDLMLYNGFIDKSKATKEFKDIQKAKLDRMKQFCEENTCRRNVVLSYFGEHREDTCGTCDNCRNPPQSFDGTILTQKALSAAIRSGQNEGIATVIDILRGSKNQNIVSKGYQELKTFGIGKDISGINWKIFIMQIINQGYLELLYHEGSRLRCTEKAKSVLFDGQRVQLYNIGVEEKKKPLVLKKSKEYIFQEKLFEKLRILRKEIADKEGIAPYMIFHDKTLSEIVTSRPTTHFEFEEISGVGEHKLEKYGEAFIKAVIEFIEDQRNDGEKEKGNSFTETLSLIKQGLNPVEISEKRGLNSVTVFSHYIYLFEKGHNVNLEKYITPEHKQRVFSYLRMNPSDAAKKVFESFNEEIPYSSVRIAIALFHKKRVLSNK